MIGSPALGHPSRRTATATARGRFHGRAHETGGGSPCLPPERPRPWPQARPGTPRPTNGGHRGASSFRQLPSDIVKPWGNGLSTVPLTIA
jgi:hypothetical protein